MPRRLRTGFLFILIITCIVAGSTIGWVSQRFVLDDSRLRFDRADSFNDGWFICSEGSETPVDEITRALISEKGSITLKNTLPTINDGNYQLCFRTDCEKVLISVDEQEIYTYGYNDDTDFGNRFGVVWIAVPMEKEMSGKDIHIQLTSLADHASDGSYSFYLDQKSSVFVTLLLNNAFLYCNSMLGISCALLIIISAFLHYKDGVQISRQRLYLGIFVILCQCWALSDSGFFQFFMENKALSYLITHSTFMLMPVPFLLYMTELFPRHAKRYITLACGFCGYYLLRILLYVTNIADLSDGVSITHLLIVAGVFYAIILNLKNGDSRISKGAVAGLFAFFVFVLLAIFDFYAASHLPLENLNYTAVMSLGIDVLLVSFYYTILKSRADIETRSLRFEHQAYTDAMTQVRNRAAFNEVMERLDAAAYPHLTLFMVDLNNLKLVNDTMGHPTGDKLICALVHYLKNSFQDLGKIYRYGGDEFVIIIEDTPIKRIQKAHERFNELIAKHSEENTFEISVAVGMASRQEPQNATMHVAELLHIADMAMYHIKARQKSDDSQEQHPRFHWMGQIDPSTGILTFSAFKARVYDALTTNDYTYPCIVNFDLNFFDGYNNLFGWEAGNDILKKMTDMATRLSGRKGFCAHGDADSFWVFADFPNLKMLADRISMEAKRFQDQLGDFRLFPSFGIYSCVDTSVSVTDMCSRASSAKKEIKGHFDILYAVYDPKKHLRRIDNMKLTSYMQKGLDSDEFIPYYQPKYSADKLRLVGAEVLARWSQEPGSPISPSEFASLFENSGLILSLDWYMLDKACSFLRKQLDAGIRCVPISTNFSRLHIYEDDCVERIRSLIKRYRIPRELIEIELTETAYVHSVELVSKLINRLRSEGITVSLDDFGSGLSSLGLLKNLSVDFIKIDRSLVENSTNDNTDSSILQFVTSLCSHLKIRTIAEGVETKAQFKMIRQSGCDMIQGNYLAPAMPEMDFEKMLVRYSSKEMDNI